MMIGAAGVKPDKLTPLALTAGQQAIGDRRQARQRRAIDRVKLIWWRDDWESIGATSQSLRLAVPADRRYKLPSFRQVGFCRSRRARQPWRAFLR